MLRLFLNEFILTFVSAGDAFQLGEFNNIPPTLYLDRDWNVLENETIGQVVARVQAHANDQDILTFEISRDDSMVRANFTNLPFEIDPVTGIVRLNDTLQGHAGERFFLYVSVNDSHSLPIKTQVMVNIRSPNVPYTSNSWRPAGPQNFLPKFSGLPGVPAQPSLSLPPLPPLQSPVTNRPSNVRPKQKHTYPDSADNDESDNDASDTPSSSSTVPPIVRSNAKNRTKIETTMTAEESLSQTTLKTILPIAIIGAGIIIAAGLIVSSFLFRKRLCAIGKSLKKKSKEEMAKKSNQSNSSHSNNGITMSSLSEDSRNSIVMQHWNGPTAFSNRYVPWERDGIHAQVSNLAHFESTFDSIANVASIFECEVGVSNQCCSAKSMFTENVKKFLPKKH